MMKIRLPGQERQEMRVQSLWPEDPLEQKIAIHSSSFAWEILRTKESGGLYSPWGQKESDTTEWLSTHTLF